MRKTILTLAALAAFGIAMPAATQSASAETVVIKKDRGHHYGWTRGHHYGWRNHRAERVVVVKRHHREPRATVGVQVR
jgi:Spy/CpxP family protein refolding chaperone